MDSQSGKALLNKENDTHSGRATNKLNAKTPHQNRDGGKINKPLYHIGIETGGTTCKVGIMKGAKSLAILK